jgi:hypothetical protein
MIHRVIMYLLSIAVSFLAGAAWQARVQHTEIEQQLDGVRAKLADVEQMQAYIERLSEVCK